MGFERLKAVVHRRVDSAKSGAPVAAFASRPRPDGARAHVRQLPDQSRIAATAARLSKQAQSRGAAQ
jgi:hypothetical protein